MAKLTANLEEGSSFQPIEKGIYSGYVSAQQIQNSSKTGAPMIALQVTLDDGEFAGRILPGGPNSYFFTMAGGKKEDGTKYDLGRMFDLINALKAPWTCTSCGKTQKSKFAKEKGKYHCPSCGKPASIDFDTDDFQGLRAKWVVDVEKMRDSDDMRNVIKSAKPLD